MNIKFKYQRQEFNRQLILSLITMCGIILILGLVAQW